MSAPSHPSDFALHKGGPEVAAHLGTCASCQRRAQTAHDEREAFLRSAGPRLLAAVRRRGAPRSRTRRVWALAALPALAIGGFLLFFSRFQPPETDRLPAGVKGPQSAAVDIVVKRGTSTFRLAPGSPVRPGDSLGFVWGGPQAHVAILIRDSDGAMQRFFPSVGRAVAVRNGERLPGSAIVDARPGRELVVVMVANRPFSPDGRDGKDVRTTRIELDKEP